MSRSVLTWPAICARRERESTPASMSSSSCGDASTSTKLLTPPSSVGTPTRTSDPLIRDGELQGLDSPPGVRL